MKEFIWFNISLMYSALCGGYAANTSPGPLRFFLVFMAIHGALWAIFRAMYIVAQQRHRLESEQRQ